MTNLTQTEFDALAEFASKRPTEILLGTIEQLDASMIFALIRKGCMMITGSNGKAFLQVTAQGAIEIDKARAAKAAQAKDAE